LTVVGPDLTGRRECIAKYGVGFGASRGIKPIAWALQQEGLSNGLIEAEELGTNRAGLRG
jgi:hypothetical protein